MCREIIAILAIGAGDHRGEITAELKAFPSTHARVRQDERAVGTEGEFERLLGRQNLGGGEIRNQPVDVSDGVGCGLALAGATALRGSA
jgi:hypothetical protein